MILKPIETRDAELTIRLKQATKQRLDAIVARASDHGLQFPTDDIIEDALNNAISEAEAEIAKATRASRGPGRPRKDEKTSAGGHTSKPSQAATPTAATA